jgi:hypothetical protein
MPSDGNGASNLWVSTSLLMQKGVLQVLGIDELVDPGSAGWLYPFGGDDPFRSYVYNVMQRRCIGRRRSAS